MLHNQISDSPKRINYPGRQQEFLFGFRCRSALFLIATGHIFHGYHLSHPTVRCWAVIQEDRVGKWPLLVAHNSANVELVCSLNVGKRRCHCTTSAAIQSFRLKWILSFKVSWGRGSPFLPSPTPRSPGPVPRRRGRPWPPVHSVMCARYTAVCCYNAPINVPFDILRAIYKSCRLSFGPSLMLSRNALASRSRLRLLDNPVNKHPFSPCWVQRAGKQKELQFFLQRCIIILGRKSKNVA